eukprot:9501569-Alexandrium_andersonii.AAC.1
MSASLVGSEMCIRDSPPATRSLAPRSSRPASSTRSRRSRAKGVLGRGTVSYTHLTLPTICSV